MKAVIMAGGEGTRLRPLTCGIPKPMVPILNKPVMEYTINLLKKYDIKDIAVTMAYFPQVIVDYFGDGSEWGVNIHYFTEDTPLGTGGSVKNAEEFLDDTFIIISGDAMTDINIGRALMYHRQKKSKATLVLKKVSIPLEYGVVITDENGKIIRFLEKPSWGEVFSDTINTGIYVLEPEVLDYFKKGDNFDFSKDLFPKLLRDEVPMYGFITEEYWNDIGDLKVYQEVNFDLLNGKVQVDLPYKQIKEGIWVGEHTKISEDAKLTAPCCIGNNCEIDATARIEGSVIGDNSEVGHNSSVKRSILWKNVNMKNNVQSRGAVLCNNVLVRNNVHVFENTVIGSGTQLLSGAMIRPDVKIWPEKTIQEDAVVNQSLVWGTKISKTLFGFKDISGDVNIDISPEFASRLGTSFGSMLKDDAKVVISTDNSGAALLIKESIVSGILSTGVKVIDIESVSSPINRFAVRFYRGDGGIHIRRDYDEGKENKIHIEFVNKDGINIDRNTERKIENIFAREDFKRCTAEKIKGVTRVDNFSEFYIQNGANILDNLSRIKAIGPKLLISSKSEHISLLASSYLESIGCKVEVDYSYSGYKYPSTAEYLTAMSGMVVRSGAAMGLVFSEDGESVILIDHTGKIVHREKYTALISLVVLKSGAESRLVVPHTASRIIESMAQTYNAQVVRTKSSTAEIMKAMIESSSLRSGNMLQYILNFDAIWASGKLVDYLLSNNMRLNDLINQLPVFHMEKREVKCDWKHKGRVIREIIEENKNNDIELFEGVRINRDKGWVIVLPDSEKPVCNIYTEGFSEEYARELSGEFCDKIEQIIFREEE